MLHVPQSRQTDTGMDTTLFPLPLTPIEHVFFKQDRPTHPIQFFCRLRFAGVLNEEVLREALCKTIERHPVFQAVVHATSDECCHWQDSRGITPGLRWLDQEPEESYPHSTFLDIQKTPGLEITVVAGRARSDLIVQVHHAACDGIGSLDFLADLLTMYANCLSGIQTYRLRQLKTEQFRRRGQFGVTFWKWLRSPCCAISALVRVMRFSTRKPVPLMPQRPDYGDSRLPADYPEGCFHRFSREESAAIQSVARKFGRPINNLLSRDLFLALERWRTAEGYAGAEDWLRIVIPTSLRTLAQRTLPVANLVSNLYLDHQASELQDPDKILVEIDREIKLLKRNQLGLMFSGIFGILERFPKLFRKTVGRDRCWGTMLLTNLGPVLTNCFLPRRDGCLELADLVLDNVEMLPGIPAYQCVNFSVNLYGGRLSLGMSYDSRAITVERARNLLDCFVAQIRQSAAVSPTVQGQAREAA